MSALRVFLSGPMTGRKHFNFLAFDAAAKRLREKGYVVFSPADNDRVNGFNGNGKSGTLEELIEAGFSKSDAMCECLTWITRRADMVVTLPGWEKSAGARAEVATAEALGLPVVSAATMLGEDWLEAA